MTVHTRGLCEILFKDGYKGPQDTLLLRLEDDNIKDRMIWGVCLTEAIL